MQARIIDLPEVRCNFCFNWITGTPLVKKGLNSCMNCIDKYLNQKFQVHTPAGTIYYLTLHNQEKRLDSMEIMECRSIHQEEKIEGHEERRNKLRLPSIAQV